MLPTIATRRLLLTPFADTDINALHEFWCGPEVREYLWDNVEITLAPVPLKLCIPRLPLSLGMGWATGRSEPGPIITHRVLWFYPDEE